MASTEILSQTLSNITEIKLEEISSQRSTFEDIKSRILHEANNQHDQREKLVGLIKGLREVDNLTKLSPDNIKFLDNTQRFIEQAHRDPSVSPELQADWEKQIRDLLDIQSLKYEYASLYGRMVTEWISAAEDKTDAGTDDGTSSTFEKVGRKEMHDQRATWEEYVFTPLETDTTGIKRYLENLFTSNKVIKSAFNNLKNETKKFEKSMTSDVHFHQKSLEWVIRGLLRSDVLTDQKKTLLKDFLNNKVVLTEIADVLNMRISSLDKWQWDPAGTPVEQRRQLNGRYRFYHDEDLLQTILLRYIGVKWSVHFKKALTEFQESEGVWRASAAPVLLADQKRREYFLGTCVSKVSVETTRSDHFVNDIFLEQLTEEADEVRGGYGDDSESPEDNRKSGQQITQHLLHVLAAEIIMKTRLGDELTVVRTDFKWFGPSLPHSTMFAVLSSFGVSEGWISFFRRALEAPMKFVQDGPDAPVQVRKRGTPISGPLSDMLGETVLFCLDLAFNQETNGARMYRLHDDIWFWGEEKVCIKGWKVMEYFAGLTGLEFNETKTGSAKITRKSGAIPKLSSGLPKGDVRWGFLKLDASTGRFLIDDESVEDHIKELRLQLDACKSVFDFIQAWNVYGARFFTNNFGKPANCYGREHVDMLLKAHSDVQTKLFDGGNVTTTLKKMLHERFGVLDIPDGYLYFPMSMGGLELKNPFVELYLIRDNISVSPEKHMDIFFEKEEEEYRRAKTAHGAGGHYGRRASHIMHAELGNEPFMSFEEFTRHREQTSIPLNNAYTDLISEPRVQSILPTSQIENDSPMALSDYHAWLVQLYGANMTACFGGLNVVEQGLLPTGMVTMFRESRFKWRG